MPLGNDQWETVAEAHRRIKDDPSHVCRERTCSISYSHSLEMPWEIWRRVQPATATATTNGLIFDLDRGYLNPESYHKYLADLRRNEDQPEEEEASMPTRSTGRERLDSFKRKGSANPSGDDPETTGLRVNVTDIEYWLGAVEYRGVMFRSDQDGSLPGNIFNQMSRQAPMDIEYHYRMLGCAIEPYDRCIFINLDPSEDRDFPWVGVVVLNSVADAHVLHAHLGSLLAQRFHLLLAWYSENRERLEAERKAKREADLVSPEVIDFRLRNARNHGKSEALTIIADVLQEAGRHELTLNDPALLEALHIVTDQDDAPAAVEFIKKTVNERTQARDERADRTYLIDESNLVDEPGEVAEVITGEKGEQS